MNRPGERLEASRTSQRPAYRDVTHLSRAGRVAPAAFPDLILEGADILG